MARHPGEALATDTLTLRLSHADRDLLDRLVTLRAAELEADGIDVTAASYVRGLIRRDAKARGLEPSLAPEPAKPPAPTGQPNKDPAPTAKGRSAPTADEVRAALVRAVEGGAVGAEIARIAKLDRGHLSRFKNDRGGLSLEALAALAAVPVVAKGLGKDR